MNILTIDIGGTNVKIKTSHEQQVIKFPSGNQLTPQQMVDGVKEHAKEWNYEAVSIGFPGPVVRGKIQKEPVNLGDGWVDFDFGSAFGKQFRLINDAAMQALGSYEGGRMLFLGLGTGLGSALIVENVIAPLEIGHLPYRKKKSFEQWVGKGGYEDLGKKKWREVVDDVVCRLRDALLADYVVLGGGNAKKLQELPKNARLGGNENAFTGGFRLWQDEYSHSY